MTRDKYLIYALLDRLIKGSGNEYKLNLHANDLAKNMREDKRNAWPAWVVEGHIYLLEDGGYIEIRDASDGPTVKRVTLAGHLFYEDLSRTMLLKDNPFWVPGADQASR